jgi:hypothetical protein
MTRHAQEYEYFACGYAAILVTAVIHIVRELYNHCYDNTTADILRRFVFLVSHDAVKFHVLQSNFDVGERQLMRGFIFDKKRRNLLVRSVIIYAKLVGASTRRTWLCSHLSSHP